MKYRTTLGAFVFALLAMIGGSVLGPTPTDHLWVVAVVSLSLGIIFILIRMRQLNGR